MKKKKLQKLLGVGTLIIGVKGKNGIVLGSDKKIIREGGAESDFEDKIHIFNTSGKGKPIKITFVATGYVGIAEDFLEIFEEALKDNIKAGKITNLLDVKFLAEDMLLSFEERYASRLQESPLGFMVGGLKNLSQGEARLYTVFPPGFGEKTKYCGFIGHGSPYARTIAKYLFDREQVSNFSIEKIAERIAIVLYWIGEEVDSYAGGKPQIVTLKDGNPKFEILKIDEEKIKKRVIKLKETLRNLKL